MYSKLELVRRWGGASAWKETTLELADSRLQSMIKRKVRGRVDKRVLKNTWHRVNEIASTT